MEEVVCNPVQLSEYLTLPSDPPDPNFSLVDVSRSLCRDLTHSQSMDLAAMVVEELNVVSVVENMINVKVEAILAHANVTQAEGEQALRALEGGISALTTDLAGDVEALVGALNGSYEEDYTAAMYTGYVLCGNPDALVLNLDWSDDEGAGGDGDGGGGGGGGDGGNGTEPAYDQCRNLMTALDGTKTGSYA